MENKKVDVKGFLESQNIPFKMATSGEIIILTCPICGTPKKKFYINSETGLYDCKICGGRGNFFSFKSKYGIVDNVKSPNSMTESSTPLDLNKSVFYEDLLYKTPTALDYLHSRGFTDETIMHFHLGYDIDSQGEWIAIPHFKDGKLWNIKYRRFAGGDKIFRRITGYPTILFNSGEIPKDCKSVVVVESETDCIAAWQMGVRNVIGLTGGAETFKPEWASFFARFELVYIALNSDEVGQKGARRLAEKIGLKKVKNLILPTNDVNDYLKSPEHRSEDFKLEFNRAMRIEMKNVSSAEDIANSWDEWYSGEDSQLKGLSTGFERLDSLIHGFKPSDLIILSGDSGVGKTTFLNIIVSHFLYQKQGVFGFYLEGQMPYMLARMIGAKHSIEYDKLNLPVERFEKIKEEVSELPLLYFSGSHGDLSTQYLKEFIPVMVDLYGVKLIVIDNLQKVVRGEDAMYYQRVSETVEMLKSFAVDHKVPIVLISHIKKVDASKNVITKYDAKASSTIYQACDVYLILQRIKGEMYLTLEKNRMGEDGLNIPLEVDYKLGQFREKEDSRVTPQPTNPKSEVVELGFD